MGGLNIVENNDLLQFAITEGIIDLSSVREKLNMKEREKFLSEHPYSIWQGENKKWYTRLPDDDKGKILKKRNTKKEIEDLVVKYYKDLVCEPTVNKMLEEWIAEKYDLKEISKSCYDRYICDYNRYLKKSAFGKLKIRNITELDMEMFIRMTISELQLTSKAYSGLRTLLKGTFAYAKKHNNTTISISNFFGDLQLSKTVFKKNLKDKTTQVYSEDEIVIITDYLKKLKSLECLGILLVFQTGLRVGELAALKQEDVVGRGLNIRRTEVKFKDEKTGKQQHIVKDFPKSDAGFRTLIMSKEAKNTIENILALNPDGEYLFYKNNHRILAINFGFRLKGICKELNISFRSMHKIRKTYGTTLIDNNVDESTVVEQMGHSDIKCTKQYYYFGNKSTQKKIEQIDSAISW